MRKVWYYAKWDQIFIQTGQVMFTVDDGVTISILIDSIRDWRNFHLLGDL